MESRKPLNTPKTIHQQYLEDLKLVPVSTGSCTHVLKELVVIGGFEAQKCIHCGALLHAVGFQEGDMDIQHVKDTAHPETAAEFLDAAKGHMQDRAATYDAPNGERSMATAINMFNELKGTDLTATDGWEFMTLLKMVRANQGEFKSDNYEDMVAYAALAGEQAVQDNAPRMSEDFPRVTVCLF